MELLEVLDENGNKTGKIEDKDIIHKEGLWHIEVEVWIMNEDKKILIQKRAPQKKQAPNKWSLTAGHVDVGESVEDAIAREIKEEIGIDCKIEDIKLMYRVKHSSYRGDNNAFRYGYIYRTNKKMEEFVLQKEEVAEVKYITISELEKIIKRQDDDCLYWRWKYIKEAIKCLKENI